MVGVHSTYKQASTIQGLFLKGWKHSMNNIDEAKCMVHIMCHLTVIEVCSVSRPHTTVTHGSKNENANLLMQIPPRHTSHITMDIHDRIRIAPRGTTTTSSSSRRRMDSTSSRVYIHPCMNDGLWGPCWGMCWDVLHHYAQCNQTRTTTHIIICAH